MMVNMGDITLFDDGSRYLLLIILLLRYGKLTFVGLNSVLTTMAITYFTNHADQNASKNKMAITLEVLQYTFY